MSRATYIAANTGRGSVAVHHAGDEKRRMYGTKKNGATRQRRERDLLLSMSIEELQEAAKEKAPNRCATEFALKAQVVLRQRLNHEI